MRTALASRLLAVVLALTWVQGSVHAQDSKAEAAKKKSKFQRSKLTNDESEITADHRRMLLTVGEDKAVDLDFDTALESKFISVGDPAKVLPQLVKVGDKKQIVFKPLKTGETTVTVRDGEGAIRVIFNVRITGSSLQRVESEVKSLLRDIEGLDIRIVGPKVVIEGEVLVPADFARLLTVVQDKTYADFILNMAQLSPIALGVIAKRIQEDVTTFAPNVKTRVVNGRIFLEGTVDNDGQAAHAEKMAFLYLPEFRPPNPLTRADPQAQGVQFRGNSPIVNFIIVNPPSPKKQAKLIRLTVHFVELSKDYNRLFGFKWEPGFTADPQITVGQQASGGAGASNINFTATISSLIPKLTTAQNAGYARILKSGTIIVRSGEKANLSDITSIPFLAASATGGPAGSAAQVGLSVGVTAQILGQSEDIDMELQLKQTNLVGRVPANGGQPLTSSHEVHTKLYVKSAESAAVAGVNSSDVGTDFNKDDPAPGGFQGGQTDPLFTLLHSKSYRKKKSQFVIFVTPQIVENASDGTDDLKRNFRVKVR